MYLIITAMPRSGTRFTATLLRKLGAEIGHEIRGKDGIVSWPLVDQDGDPYISSCFSNLPEDNVIYHQVRSPLRTISSLTTINNDSWSYIYKAIPKIYHKDLLTRCMRLYYFWNLRGINQADHVYNVEEIEDVIEDMFDDIGKTPKTDINNTVDKLKKRNINTRKHEDYTWEQLVSRDAKLAEDIRSMFLE